MEVLVTEAPSFRFGIADSSPYTRALLNPNTLFDPHLLLHHFAADPVGPTEDVCGSGIKHDEFTFDSSVLQEIKTADMLFEKGRIRPLMPIQPAFSSRSQRGSRPRPASLEFELPVKNQLGSSPSSSAKNADQVLAKGGTGKKWLRLKKLFLFRSASEARSKDPLLPKAAIFSPPPSLNKKKRSGEGVNGRDKAEEWAKRGGGGDGPSVLLHEMFYKAAAKEKGKKTPLPYQRNGLYTCFNPTHSGHPWLLR